MTLTTKERVSMVRALGDRICSYERGRKRASVTGSRWCGNVIGYIDHDEVQLMRGLKRKLEDDDE